MKISSVEVRYDSMSRFKEVLAANALVRKHHPEARGMYFFVTFTDPGDPDLEELISLVSGMRETDIFIDDRKVRPSIALIELAFLREIPAEAYDVLCQGNDINKLLEVKRQGKLDIRFIGKIFDGGGHFDVVGFTLYHWALLRKDDNHA